MQDASSALRDTAAKTSPQTLQLCYDLQCFLLSQKTTALIIENKDFTKCLICIFLLYTCVSECINSSGEKRSQVEKVY